jgi:hypothetical protein
MHVYKKLNFVNCASIRSILKWAKSPKRGGGNLLGDIARERGFKGHEISSSSSFFKFPSVTLPLSWLFCARSGIFLYLGEYTVWWNQLEKTKKNSAPREKFHLVENRLYIFIHNK